MSTKIWLLGIVMLCMRECSAEKILVASPPKTGTHQTKKLIELLIDGAQHIPVPREQDFFVKLYPQFVNKINDTWYHLGHYIGMQANRELARKHKLKVILNMRDPRNQVVSFARERKYQFKGLPLEEVITIMIRSPQTYWKNNKGWACPEVMAMHSLQDFYHLYLGWLEYPDVCIVKFENIIGPYGEGTLEKQLHEIKKVAQFLGIRLSSHEVEDIAQRLWGGTHTFSGKTSDWRNYFTQEHKKMFKEVAGDLLIELGYESDYDW